MKLILSLSSFFIFNIIISQFTIQEAQASNATSAKMCSKIYELPRAVKIVIQLNKIADSTEGMGILVTRFPEFADLLPGNLFLRISDNVAQSMIQKLSSTQIESLEARIAFVNEIISATTVNRQIGVQLKDGDLSQALLKCPTLRKEINFKHVMTWDQLFGAIKNLSLIDLEQARQEFKNVIEKKEITNPLSPEQQQIFDQLVVLGEHWGIGYTILNFPEVNRWIPRAMLSDELLMLAVNAMTVNDISITTKRLQTLKLAIDIAEQKYQHNILQLLQEVPQFHFKLQLEDQPTYYTLCQLIGRLDRQGLQSLLQKLNALK